MLFPLQPNFVSVVTPIYKTSITEFENGREQRSSNQHLEKVKFQLTFSALPLHGDVPPDFEAVTSAYTYGHQYWNAQTLSNFYAINRGRLTSFTYKPHIYTVEKPEGWTVRFNTDDLELQLLNINYVEEIIVELISVL